MTDPFSSVGGKVPPKPFTITEFYPVFVTQGTRHMAENDFLQAALRMRRAQILTASTR